MKKIEISQNKRLKLTNVVSRKVELNELVKLDRLLELMEAYIKSKGAQSIGPMIQVVHKGTNENGEAMPRITIMRQANRYIEHTEEPYQCTPVVQVKKCLFSHFVGEEKNIKHVYDKMNLLGFEEEIKLTGDIYTIFINRVDNVLTADVFMEIEE
jgi:hypothetical protein